MRIGYIAIGLAAVVGVVPASFAQDSRVLDHGKLAGTRTEGEERQAHQTFGGNTGISLAVPIGRVSVGPDLVGGDEPIYVRRTTVSGGITIVEVSTTPFVAVLSSNKESPGVRPDQPAGW
jgi:hypothetical protein